MLPVRVSVQFSGRHISNRDNDPLGLLQTPFVVAPSSIDKLRFGYESVEEVPAFSKSVIFLDISKNSNISQ